MREQLADALDWGEAHADFDRAVDRFPVALRGRRVKGLPYSAWQILEHLRLAQHDMLDFATNARYAPMKWPDDYWPKAPAPPTARAWNASVAAFRKDRRALKRLAANPRLDLSARIPHGDGQTYIREILLALDHNAYHVGELIVLRRLLGAWK
ncbi:MAG TPA: DinB family protein [Vicinamibacterales bacterium]|jgi:hypothetical protein|nr:DinB family protein [Vicinamibacterales bacterium]